MISLRKIISSYRMLEARDFSCVLCPLPEKIADEIREWGKKNIAEEDLTGDGREPNIHVTLLYGLHGHDPFEIRTLVWNFGKVNITLGDVTLFSQPEHDVVKIDVISQDLQKLHNQIAETVENTQSFPEYLPHITVSYVRPGTGQKYAGSKIFADQEITLDSALFSGNDYRETELRFNPHLHNPEE